MKIPNFTILYTEGKRSILMCVACAVFAQYMFYSPSHILITSLSNWTGYS